MKVMQAAQHVDHNIIRNLEAIRRIRPRSVGMTEMDAGFHDNLADATSVLAPAGYTICTADNGGLHCHEVPIAFRTGRTYKIDSVQVTQLSQDLGAGLGNDRHLTVVRFHNRFTRRKGAHAHTHWNAGLQGPHGNMLNVDRVRAAEQGSILMESILKGLLDEGRDLRVTGDFNWRMHDNDAAFHVWRHSPPAMFDRLGLDYISSGLDWMAWSKKTLTLSGDPRIIPPGQGGNGSDHPWIVATLRRKAVAK